VVYIMSLLKIMECQRPVPASNMYAPSAQVFVAGPKPRYVIGCYAPWKRGRVCARAYARYATRLLKQRKEAPGSSLLLPRSTTTITTATAASITFYSIKLVPSSACVTITATSR